MCRVGAPSRRYVAERHALFLRRMEEIFEKYKAEFGYGEEETVELVDANPDRR